MIVEGLEQAFYADNFESFKAQIGEYRNGDFVIDVENIENILKNDFPFEIAGIEFKGNILHYFSSIKDDYLKAISQKFIKFAINNLKIDLEAKANIEILDGEFTPYELAFTLNNALACESLTDYKLGDEDREIYPNQEFDFPIPNLHNIINDDNNQALLGQNNFIDQGNGFEIRNNPEELPIIAQTSFELLELINDQLGGQTHTYTEY